MNDAATKCGCICGHCTKQNKTNKPTIHNRYSQKFLKKIREYHPSQCCRSGSASISFWALGHRYGSVSGSGSFHSSPKNKKNLDFYCFVTSLWLFIFEEWCKRNVPLFRFPIRVWILMFLGLPDPHPDPLVRATDPRIQIRNYTKMSRIRNTAKQ